MEFDTIDGSGKEHHKEWESMIPVKAKQQDKKSVSGSVPCLTKGEKFHRI